MDSTDSILCLVFFLLRSFCNFYILSSNIIERVDVLGVCGKVLVGGDVWSGPCVKRLRAALCCMQPFPTSFTTDPPWTKAEPISKTNGTSMCLKRGKNARTGLKSEKKGASEGKRCVPAASPCLCPLCPSLKGWSITSGVEGDRGIGSEVERGKGREG